MIETRMADKTRRSSPVPGSKEPASTLIGPLPGFFDPSAASSRQTDCGDFGIHISSDGTWWYQGSPIGRPALVKLFASVLRRDATGGYWLVTPMERGRVSVEDAPFTAVELTVAGDGPGQILTFRTNLDDIVTADEGHPIRVDNDDVTGEPNPYILVRAGLEARLTRAVFYQLVDIGREERVADAALFGVWSKGHFFPLGSLAEKS